MTQYEEKIYAIALSIISSPGFNRIWDLIATCSSSEIYRVLSERTELKTQRYLTSVYPGNPLESAKLIFDKCASSSIRILDYWDEDYPELLRQINKPPVILYCKGNLFADNPIAIVGTRKSDRRSSDIARRISGELAGAGYVITSGMAIGIDREAHLGALQSNSPTIGVLANGIDIVYPAYNRDIYNAILKSGRSCLVSEYPPGIYAGKWTFARRNRVISGLSLGTVVVKAAKKSGALITARYALEQNREIFACPGYAFDKSYEGCHNLINNGAVLVAGVDDILREINLFSGKKILRVNRSDFIRDENRDLFSSDNEAPRIEESFSENSIEKRIMEILAAGEMDVDGIVRLLECGAGEVNEALIMLELSNAISRDGNFISRTQ